MAEAVLRVFRGGPEGGEAVEYRVPVAPGMVVLDALHYIQGRLAPDLAVRLNCKTRLDALPLEKPITVSPMKAFPVVKDLVTDVSWNYRVNRKIPPFSPRRDVEWKMDQRDVDRVQEFRKCI